MSTLAEKIYNELMQDYDSDAFFRAVAEVVRHWIPSIDSRTEHIIASAAIELIADDSDSNLALEIRFRLRDLAERLANCPRSR